MLANLVANSVVTDTGINARMYDIIKLLTGEITRVDQLNTGVWDTANSYVNATVPGNWTVSYSSQALSGLATSSATAWSYVLEKASANSSITTKTVQAKLERATASLNLYGGSYNVTTGAGIFATTAALVSGAVSTAGTYTVYSGGSGFFLLAQNALTLCLLTERPAFTWEEKTQEPLSVLAYATTSTQVAPTHSGYYNTLTRGYSTLTFEGMGMMSHPNNPTGVTRNSESLQSVYKVPLYVHKLSRAWFCDLTAYTGVYRTVDSYSANMSAITVGGTPYRLIAIGNLRYLVPDA